MTARPSRILLTADAVGGVWQYTLDLARGLSRLGLEPVIALLGPSPSPDQRKAAAGIRLIEPDLPLDWLAEDEGAVLTAGKALAEIAQRERVDLVQLQSASLAAGGGFAVPVIAVQHSCVASWWETVRGTPLPQDFAWRAELTRRGLEAADAVVAPTQAFAETTQRIYGLARTPHAVHNGRIPLSSTPAPQVNAVLTAGRLWDEGKNLATLDAAAGLLDVPVRAAGPVAGPNGSAIAFSHIEALGNLDESALASHFAARSIFASAALYEPFGLAVLEAAQAGCALVLSDIPTFRELWEDAATFVPAHDSQAFATAIDALIGNPDMRGRAGAAARERAARYTPDATAAAMAKLYRSLMPLPVEAAA